MELKLPQLTVRAPPRAGGAGQGRGLSPWSREPPGEVGRPVVCGDGRWLPYHHTRVNPA